MREEQGRLTEAETLYRQAIAADAEFPEAYAGLGDVLRAEGDRPGAADAYREFLRLASDVASLKPYLGEYKNRLLSIDPDGPLVGSNAIVAALTTKPKATVLTRSVNIVGRDLDKPHIDIAINFDFNSASIRFDSVRQVEEVAHALTSNKLSNVRVRIEGHTDSVGSDSYNKALSEQRAASVRAMLVDRFGVSPSALEVVGMGETAPVASNDTDAGRALNRRVTFVNVGS